MGRNPIISLALLTVVCTVAPVAAAPVITKVERLNPDNNSGDTEPVLAADPLADGSLAFVDRAHVYKNVPEALVGAEYVMTANDDKDNPNFELHITVDKAAILYVLLDNRIGTNTNSEAGNPNSATAGMTWMAQMGFVDTGWNIALDEAADGTLNSYFSLFSKQVAPGVAVLKAQNDTSTGGPGSRNMYAVAAVLPRMTASKPSPADGEQAVIVPLFEWTPGATAILHDVYLGMSPELTEADLVSAKSPLVMYFHGPGLSAGTTYYWRVDEIEVDLATVHTGEVWSFTAATINAFAPVPADGAEWVDPATALSWTAGKDAISHDLYFSADKAAVESGAADAFQKTLYLATWQPPALESGATYYWRVDESVADGTKNQGAVWSFSTVPVIEVSDPSLLGWWKMDEGTGAIVVDWSGHGHHAAFGNPAPKWATGHFGGALEFAGNGDSIVHADGSFLNGLSALTVSAWVKSDLTNTDKGFIIFAGPAGNDDRDMRYDAAGSLAGGANVVKVGITVAVEGAANSVQQIESSSGVQTTDWQHLTMVWGSGRPLQLYINGSLDTPTSISAAATGAVVGCSTVIIGRGGKDNPGSWDGLIDEIRIYDKALTGPEIQTILRGDPSLAWDPSPANGLTTDAVAAVPLTWQAGDGAARHDVYLGSDQAAVAQADASDTTGVYRGRRSDASFTPDEPLVWGQKYFWRVDEVNADDSISRGFVWSFTLTSYLIVDEFETYTDDDGSRIYQTWIDGYADQSNGSTVGNLDAPFAEQTIVHGGRQSMPMDYNNTDQPFYSEAEREFSPVQNWTINGLDTLSLWVRGYPVSFVETASGITMSAFGADIFNAADEFRFAFKQLTGDGAIVAKVESIGNSNGWAKGGVMIRENLNPDSRFAIICATPGNGVRFQARLLNAGNATSDTLVATPEQIALRAPVWVKLERSDSSFSGFYSTDGVTWTAMSWNPQTIAMGAGVYIGLALSSHNATTSSTAVFSDVVTTGGVSGPWQTAEIGVAHPGNSPSALYVTIQDSTGKTATATDPTLVTTAAWTEWRIPLSSLAGVNLGKVEKMIVGVGDKENPQKDGRGRIFIDDIHLTMP